MQALYLRYLFEMGILPHLRASVRRTPFSSFDRNVFESIVDKVIIGDYSNPEKPEPYQLTFFIYSYYLLAQFQVKELFPSMVDLLSVPSDICENIFGDAIIEDIGRILASVYNGAIESLFTLIENTEANEYARGQALISLVVLVFNDQLSREFVIDYFKQLLTDKLAADTSYYFNAEIVCCCDDLYPEEVYADIGRLYEEELVEEIVIGMDSINKTLRRTKEEVLQSNQQDYRFQFITETIKEIQGWACFKKSGYKD